MALEGTLYILLELQVWMDSSDNKSYDVKLFLVMFDNLVRYKYI